MTTQDCPGSRASDPGACCLPPNKERLRPVCTFSKLNTQPTYSPVYASPCASRRPAQNSGPSGSLLLSREEFSSSASCRFIPAHLSFVFIDVSGSFLRFYRGTAGGYPLTATIGTGIGYHSSGSLSSKKRASQIRGESAGEAKSYVGNPDACAAGACLSMLVNETMQL